jgi:hypothetical protein
MSNTNTEARKTLVTLNKTPAHQPTTEETGATGQWYAYESRFVVRTVWPEETAPGGTTFHGAWFDEEQAKRYARSADNGGYPRAEVVEVAPYWYVHGFGQVGQVGE